MFCCLFSTKRMKLAHLRQDVQAILRHVCPTPKTCVIKFDCVKWMVSMQHHYHLDDQGCGCKKGEIFLKHGKFCKLSKCSHFCPVPDLLISTFVIGLFFVLVFSFLSDPSPIIALPCHSFPQSLCPLVEFCSESCWYCWYLSPPPQPAVVYFFQAGALFWPILIILLRIYALFGVLL